MNKAVFSALALAIAMPANAVVITSLATGTDGAGNVLPGGAADALYTVVEIATPAIVISTPAGSWLPNDSTSKWVWETRFGLPTFVTRSFRVGFDTTGFDLSTVVASGRWSTDNTGLDILVNGVGTGNTCGGFTAWCTFSIASGFVAGMNSIDFVVNDFGTISGFRAEGAVDGRRMPNGPVIPEPATWAMLIAGFGVVGASLRRRRTIAA